MGWGSQGHVAKQAQHPGREMGEDCCLDLASLPFPQCPARCMGFFTSQAAGFGLKVRCASVSNIAKWVLRGAMCITTTYTCMAANTTGWVAGRTKR